MWRPRLSNKWAIDEDWNQYGDQHTNKSSQGNSDWRRDHLRQRRCIPSRGVSCPVGLAQSASYNAAASYRQSHPRELNELDLQPQEPRMDVIPKTMLHDVDAAVFGAWKRGPPPPLVWTAQIVRPNMVEMNATAEMTKGRCSCSGGTNTYIQGHYWVYQRDRWLIDVLRVCKKYTR